MFTQEQYDILKRCSEERNIAEWNNYRAEQPETKINLQNADLRKASLVSANLQNADLRSVNLERADLWDANLEDVIFTEVPEESLSSPKEEVETIVNIVDDIRYEEFISLMKCLEKLSVTVGGSLPHLNEIQISHNIEKHATWAGTRWTT